MAERQFGPYRLVRQVAVGGMAEIYLAKTRGLAGFEKYVALKVIHPNFAADEQFIQMLIDEAKIAVQLGHVNIGQTFDLGRVGDTYYITMEFVDGADLFKVLRRASELAIETPVEVAAFIAKEVLVGLDYAHRKKDTSGQSLGIVHRDVSPQNVLVSYAGEVKLVDFGIAKATMKAKQTAVGVIKGKYYYMSPEQAWADPVDFRSDIFSAGIVLYEMLVGQMLYLEDDLHRLLDRVRKAEVAPPSTLRPSCPAELERIVMRALSRRPDDRYASAGDMAAELEELLRKLSPGAGASRVSRWLRQIMGDPGVAAMAPTETAPVIATIPLDDGDLVHDRADLRDENSVIFRVEDALLVKPGSSRLSTDGGPTADLLSPKVRRAREQELEEPATIDRLPSLDRMTGAQQMPAVDSAPNAGAAANADRQTREVDVERPSQRGAGASSKRNSNPPPLIGTAAKAVRDSSELPAISPGSRGVVGPGTRGVVGPGARGAASDRGIETKPIEVPDVAESTSPVAEALSASQGFVNSSEPTLINAPRFVGGVTEAGTGAAFLPAATEVGAPSFAPAVTEIGIPKFLPAVTEALDLDAGIIAGDIDEGDDEAKPSAPRTESPARVGGPAALAARNPTPAVSALHRPRASRRTPAGGVPVPGPPSVIHALVGSLGASEPLPTLAPASLPLPPVPPAGHNPAASPRQTSNLPLSAPVPTPMPQTLSAFAEQAAALRPSMASNPLAPRIPGQHALPHNPQLPQPPVAPPSASTSGTVIPAGAIQYPQLSQVDPRAVGVAVPGWSPQAAPNFTHQVRSSLEIDEIPPVYRIPHRRPAWLVPVVVIAVAASMAAVATYFLMREDVAPVTNATLLIDSVPSGATAYVDDAQLPTKTPVPFASARPGATYEVRVEYPQRRHYRERVLVPTSGGEVRITAVLAALPGSLEIKTEPPGADIYIKGELRGRTPQSLLDVDMESTKELELRHRDHGSRTIRIVWPEDGKLELNVDLRK